MTDNMRWKENEAQFRMIPTGEAAAARDEGHQLHRRVRLHCAPLRRRERAHRHRQGAPGRRGRHQQGGILAPYLPRFGLPFPPIFR